MMIVKLWYYFWIMFVVCEQTVWTAYMLGYLVRKMYDSWYVYVTIVIPNRSSLCVLGLTKVCNSYYVYITDFISNDVRRLETRPKRRRRRDKPQVLRRSARLLAKQKTVEQ